MNGAGQKTGDALALPEMERAKQRILEVLTAVEDPGDVCARILKILRGSIGGVSCAFLETRNGVLAPFAVDGIDAAQLSFLAEVFPAGAEGEELAGDALERIYSHPVTSAAGELLGSLIVIFRGRSAPSGEESGVIGTAVRVASLAIEQARLIADLKHQFLHDSLTGLANRAYFERKFLEEFSAASVRGEKLALLRVDLDRFEAMNDLLGNRLADLLLEHAAARLRLALKDSHLLARTGGDEFSVIAGRLDGPEEAMRLAEGMREALSEPIRLAGHELLVTASIGVSVYPCDGGEPGDIGHAAEDALRHAKRTGRNRAVRYEPHMARQHRERARLESRLRLALKNGEFLLHYQPQLAIRSGRMEGAEALLRWHSPEIGLVSPGAFIPLAEASGLIVPLGGWALEKACADARQWRQVPRMPQRVAVNVSTLQLAEAGFPDLVSEVLAKTGLPAEALEIELTESAVAEDSDRLLGQLERLKSIGVRLSLDDFGTGYSSLGYLQKLPFDTLKIDRSFLADLKDSTDEAVLLRNIVRLAQSLKKEIVVEGVETAAQAAALVEMGCDLLQGYHIARPMPLGQLLAMGAR
jgi:diguanylate cyclase (GGDEF)-like protein